MRYFDLISESPLVWTLFLIYMVVTAGLAWLGQKKTSGIESFAVGNGDMPPVIVGVTLAASIASTATFVLNPAFVYVHGLAALMHLGVAAGIGVIAALLLLSPGFRRVGARFSAITLPHWVSERYQSKAMGLWFSVATMLTFTFVVLIVGALATVMQKLLGLTRVESTILVVAFVFSYVFVGGAYAHAFTNTLQGLIMVIIAILLVVKGLPLLLDGGFDRLAAIDPNLTSYVNEKSPIFGTVFSIYVAGFVVGFAVICQPHILTKALYVKSDQAVRQYLGVTIAVSLAFSALLLIGLYVRLMDVPPTALIDPETGKFNQDLVVPVYVAEMFGPTLRAIVTVALLAAGMSTLDGLLVALSSIAGFDLFIRLMPESWHESRTTEQKSLLAQRAGQFMLIAIGLLAIPVALDPPDLLALFGMLGVYGLITAAVGPVLFGIFCERPPKGAVFLGSVLGTVTHLGLYWAGRWAMSNQENLNTLVEDIAWLPNLLLDTNAYQLGFLAPWVTATYGILLSLTIPLLALVWRGATSRRSGATRTAET